jgi:hypothetical protein
MIVMVMVLVRMEFVLCGQNYNGVSCEFYECPKDCSGNGHCINGKV